jgi:hypothetical protein
MSNDAEQKRVDCDEHGMQEAALVCQHLVHQMMAGSAERIGFFEPDDTPPDEARAEGFQAWCAACNAILREEGDWTERAESFAGVTLICAGCFVALKSLNA